MTAIPRSASPFPRLLWKEYRTARGFWLSLIGLAVFLQWLILALSGEPSRLVAVVFSFALGAPAFFAVGCAGMAFAIEREEGTFEFLRPAPISSGQVFASKLTMAIVATVAMFVVLMPIAFWLTRGEVPPVFTGMLGLWLVATVEALAWGTFFSLLTARPLVAICLGIAATSSFAHVLAWRFWEGSHGDFSYAPYLAAAPWRLLVAGVVFAVDVYLGRQWLHGADGTRKKRRAAPGNDKSKPAADADSFVSPRYFAKPDRGAMLGHLFWQHWRQSGRLMLIMLGLVFVAQFGGLLLRPLVGDDADYAIAMTVLATLIGCCTFRADQEQRKYRFFVEHNVPPRYVWLTRQLSWITVAFLTTFYFCWKWVGEGAWPAISEYIQSVTNYDYSLWDDTRVRGRTFMPLPPIVLALWCTAAAYAAGQWASMFVRSGIMAAFCGLLLSSLLCGWIVLMYAMQVSFFWSVAPIPLVLLFATWLRAPDWIRDNTRWKARLCAAAVLLIPAAALLIAVPNYRVNQILLVLPGFNPEKHVDEITPEAIAAGEIYRRASDAFVSGVVYESEAENELIQDNRVSRSRRALHKGDIELIKENEKSLALLLEAAERPTCCLDNPQTMSNPTWPHHFDSMINLVIASGRQLEAEEKLTDAMDRYFVGLKIVSQWSDHATSYGAMLRVEMAKRLLAELRNWAACKGQTKEQIVAAITRLKDIGPNMLRSDDAVKSDYVVIRRYLEGDEKARSAFYDISNDPKGTQDFIVLNKLMPWESDRAIRLLNLLTYTALRRFEVVRSLPATETKWDFRSQGTAAAVEYVAPLAGWYIHPASYFQLVWTPGNSPDVREMVEWFETTNPRLQPFGDAGIQAVRDYFAFEAARRATMIVLALQAYRLEHGELPPSLTELVGTYLSELPLDPYSGQRFIYFPQRIDVSGMAVEIAGLEQKLSETRGTPGIWSTGPELRLDTVRLELDQENKATGEMIPGASVTYYINRRNNERRSSYEAWSQGLWFPIPEQQ